MSNFTDFISGGGDAAPIPTTQFVIGQSKTFTAPITGRMKVIITGGGGQGAFLYNVNSSALSNEGSGTGGGAGGYSEKTFNVTAGETFTVTIGSGGALTDSITTLNSTRVGNDGGNSSFVTASAAESVNMVANGGGGGQFVAGTTAAVNVAGGTGGTASGGDFNYTGGAGGSISRVASSDNNPIVTGGGAVALYGTAYHGGNVTVIENLGSNAKIIATGGAGVGGNGGDILNIPGSGSRHYRSTGGSSTRDGISDYVGSTTTENTDTNGTAGAPTTSATISVIDAQGGGGYARAAYNNSLYSGSGGYGGGSGSAVGRVTTGNHYFNTSDAGGFGGSGALARVSTYSYSGDTRLGTGSGGIGGGGSGAFSGFIHNMNSATDRRWGPGGDGICIIMFV